MPYGKPNPLTQLPPKTPSVLIRSARYGALLTGIVYGFFRLDYLKGVYKQKMLDEQEIREFMAHRRIRYVELKNLHSNLSAYRKVFGVEKPYNLAEEAIKAQIYSDLDVYKDVFGVEKPYNLAEEAIKAQIYSNLDAYKEVFGVERPYTQAEEESIQAQRQQGVEERNAKRNAYYASLKK